MDENKETKTSWDRPQLTRPQVKEMDHHMQRGMPQVTSNSDTHANHLWSHDQRNSLKNHRKPLKLEEQHSDVKMMTVIQPNNNHKHPDTIGFI
jgi:hypothetical protein